MKQIFSEDANSKSCNFVDEGQVVDEKSVNFQRLGEKNSLEFKDLEDQNIRNLITQRDILIKGASKNNLRHVDVCIPNSKMTVITGVSGSGKTSLAFDTIFAEGQARYLESLSTYARRFLGRMDKAPVDAIDGLSPAIAINQKSTGRNPRSTVATTTEIYDYLRLLYARIGKAHCPKTGKPLIGYSSSMLLPIVLNILMVNVWNSCSSVFAGFPSKIFLLDHPKNLSNVIDSLVKEGFVRININGDPLRLDEWDEIFQTKKFRMAGKFTRNTTVVLGLIDRLLVRKG
ncbi:MAG: hypothetical protein Ct9H300mP28_14730 [Pseudomonadota bacterium]|nr:MAG: hypothetical protein Ct9H300mP28_14730 [Pseudomonadota bacterium]